MNELISFSIIIPLYNKRETISRAIHSVLSQNYDNFEIIIVDDGSSDGSAEIVNEFSDKRIKYVYKNNGGVSSARNYGIYVAKNDWIVFLDADDYFNKDALLKISLAITTWKTCRIVVGGYSLEGKDGIKIKPCKSIGIVKNPIRGYWLHLFFPRTGNMAIHKDVFSSIGMFDERISFNEDLYFALRLIQIYKIALIKESLMTYTNEFSQLSIKQTSLTSEFAYYMNSLSTENRYIRWILIEHLNYSINRRETMGDDDGMLLLKVYRKQMFSYMQLISGVVMNKLRNLLIKIL